MQTVNNFDVLDPIVANKIQSADDFLLVQLIARRKDCKVDTIGKNHSLIDTFFVDSTHSLSSLREEIIAKCNQFQCRAYIRLNKRSYNDVALTTIDFILKNIRSKQARAAYNAYLSACGKVHSDPDKTWVLDIDSKNEAVIENITLDIIFRQRFAKREPMYIRIPTTNGIHLIVRPFDPRVYDASSQILSEYYSIHKDGPTLLYHSK